MIVPFGEYTPDAAALGSQLSLARGCFPRSDKTYGSFPSLSTFSGAITARCQGAFAGRSKDGNVTNFSGDASKLYKLSTTTWSDVSKVGGYTTGSEEHWRFVQFYNRVIAVNFTDAIQTWTLDSSSAFADLSASAPKARHIASMFPGFVMVGNTFDGTDGAVPNRVWWPAIADPTNWPTPGSAAAAAVQSDFNDMPTGGWVQALVGAVGGAAGLVLMDTSIYRVEYVGPPDIYAFIEIEKARGTPCVNGAINTGAFAAYVGEDGFYLCDGSRSIPIGAGKVDKYFFTTVDQTYLYRVYGVSDPINKLLVWAFPTGGSSGNPSMLLIYNWETGRWSDAEISCELIYRSLSSGFGLDDLDSISSSIDALTPSLDSRFWTGGKLQFSAFDTTHKQALFNGSNMEARIATGEVTGDGQRLFTSGVRPIVDGGTSSARVGYRDSPDGTVSYTAYSSVGVDGICPQRISSRYTRAEVKIAAGGTWDHAIGVEINSMPDGAR